MHVPVLIEVQEVISLKQLVGELREGHALGRVAAEALLDGVLGHHVVYGDKLADVAGEIDEGIVLHPVVIVHQLRLVGGVRLEVEETRQLRLDAGDVVSEGLLVQKVALLALHRRVAYHSRGPSDKCERLVAAGLEMLEYHDTDQMPDMEAVTRGVDADICRHGSFLEFFFGPGGKVMYHAPPPEFFYEILHRMN